MIIDFLHNKIVASTVTDKFTISMSENLIPLLQEKYGDDIEGIQMYEDYLSEHFTVGKTFYYPITVYTLSRGAVSEWICWDMPRGQFEGDVPFAYLGDELLSFELVESLPEGFAASLQNRAIYCEGGSVKLRVETTASNITILSGKYSQTFIDEMARQLTPAICEAMSVKGIEDSSIELAIVFAPDTYMEHTSENTTYRRLLLVDKSSAPRDFWIKWTRLDGKGAYSVSDHVAKGEILFEIGEDVPQKIKEKEYRFLTRAGKDKYHNAMGRKNVTEWRDVIKRAIKRGDLERAEEIVAAAPINLEEKIPATVSAEVAVEPVTDIASEIGTAVEISEDEELRLAMEMARRAIDSVSEEATISDEEEEEELDELEAFYSDEPTPEASRGAVADDFDEAHELEEITRMALEALKAASLQTEADEPGESSEVAEQLEEVDELEEIDEPSLITFADDLVSDEDDGTLVMVPEDPTAEEEEIDIFAEASVKDEPVYEAPEALQPVCEDIECEQPEADEPITAADLEAKLRGEIEAKIRLEYESRARERAEQEAERLRREQEQLRLENERLIDKARREKAEWTRIEENRRAEAERLRAQIEAQVRQEAKERERLAEAARQAVEEQHRLEAERLREERIKLEEERRIEEERRRREEEERIEAARRAEAERLRREEEARAKKETAENAASGAHSDNNYTYVSKTVKLLFRRSVDPNITTRIHEILKATLEYYGKQKVYMRIKATIPDNTTVCLEFLQFPLEEMELLGNIIKVIGNSGLGIAKAILE
ncbi:MAG: hypothetical protein J6Q85_07065 [Clostridia bacterium]|nr:hypothetical protein [Clostridia bacterium]